MRRTSRILTAVALLSGGTWLAQASPILYTQDVLASGTLGSDTFTNALVQVTLLADTGGVVANFGAIPGLWENPQTAPATVYIYGIGTATFTDAMDVRDLNPLGVAGITDVTNDEELWDIFNPAFNSYDLKTPIGPLVGTSSANPDGLISYNTTAGSLSFTSIGPYSLFTAEALPEPGSFALFGIGMAGLVAVRSRRRKAVR